MLPASNNRAQTLERPARRARGRGGCFLGCVTFIILLIVIVGAGWVFALRPYVHNLAQNQLDSAMNNAVQQIPPTAALAPPGTIQVSENTIDNMIKLNIAPSDPIQNPVTHITPNGIRLEFQTYGLPNAITMVPQAVNGQIVASNVTIEGVAGLVMSPDEMKTLLNKHFADAQARIQRSVQSVQLKDHELDLQLK